MAVALANFNELSHQLRFILFEAGIGLSQSTVDYYISLAHQHCLLRLQNAALSEGLIPAPFVSCHVNNFLEQLRSKLQSSKTSFLLAHWQAFQREVDETIANQAMEFAYRHRWQAELAGQARSYMSFWAWLCAEMTKQEQNELLEQWGAVELHSQYIGQPDNQLFSRREVIQYSAAFQARFSLHWCALSRRQTLCDESLALYTSSLSDQFPKEYHLWQTRLGFMQRDPKDYIPIPVHPWQWRNHIQASCSSLIDSKELILLPHHQVARPTGAFGRVRVSGVNGNLYLRLGLGDSFVLNPAELSNELNNLLQAENNYQDTLYIDRDLSSLVAAGLRPEVEILSYRLSEAPVNTLTNTESLVPLSALFALSPITKKPLLIEIIAESGQDPLSYFQQYCQCLLSSQVHLLLNYGLVLSCSEKNSQLLLKDNKPRALILSELNHIVVADLSAHLDKLVTLGVEKVSQNLLCRQFVESNLRCNLAYWVNCLSEYFPLSPKVLWQVVASSLDHLSNLHGQQIAPALLNRFRSLLKVDAWQTPRYLTVRLTAGK